MSTPDIPPDHQTPERPITSKELVELLCDRDVKFEIGSIAIESFFGDQKLISLEVERVVHKLLSEQPQRRPE